MSESDQKFIVANAEKMSAQQIAMHLNRNVASVESYLKKYIYSPESAAVEENLAYDIQSRSFWPSLLRQFNEEELHMFKADWARTIKQFGDDVTHTEEKQIVQSCSLTIMMYRTLEEIQKTKDKLEKLEIFYQTELGRETRDRDLLIQLDNQIAATRIATNSLTIQYDKIFRDQQSLQKDLKATRDQRIDKLEAEATTFFEWLHKLQEGNNLINESKGAELQRVAMYKKYLLEGAQLHRYEDGSLDQPILNAETVELLPKEKDIDRRVQTITGT